MTGRPFPGGPRYDAEWEDVDRAALDAEKRAELRHMADLMRHAYRIAQFFPRREVTP